MIWEIFAQITLRCTFFADDARCKSHKTIGDIDNLQSGIEKFVKIDRYMAG